mmetsp:Transcript_7874/g.14281  ORF Transcript_7874/g.14281 Transcript_7874/m.14281 type:complete len:254 (-) Transcript_7874:476-1237(-)|eukprot:CAMPEP_0182448470 /NCGR_PEP_ID=MMETSP1172-20130603/27121_1 /TAXON_ID=708627 /ORGANISM="Timspurckia oligopyrenoides, Strain CCMP3278" /LENGTH=253 /DNA_ID=CAMNT_0024645343 /DNA_START=176 /DNA_END=937 /DNA_ORIENTATION=+
MDHSGMKIAFVVGASGVVVIKQNFSKRRLDGYLKRLDSDVSVCLKRRHLVGFDFKMKAGQDETDRRNRRARDGEFEEERGSGTPSVATLDPERNFDTVLQELSAIQNDGPRKVAILGTRHMSYLHQQIVELYTYANVLVGNHVITSGSTGTNSAVIRGALRAEKPDLLTVVLPQSLSRQPFDTQEQLKKVRNLIAMSENDSLPLSVASQLCNSDIIERCTHFIAFAFHDSDVVLESYREAKATNRIVTLLYLD